MDFGVYDNEDDIKVGDVVCLDMNVNNNCFYPFASCVVVEIKGNVVYLSRPYQHRGGVGMETYSTFKDTFKLHFLYYLTGTSGKKYNIYE